METLTLAQYLDKFSQVVVAERLGIHQTAISHMIKTGRRIYVTVDPVDNIQTAYEVKPIGKFRSGSVA